MVNKKNLLVIAMWLVIIGGINWGLTVLNFNLVTAILGSLGDTIINIVYGLVGISGVYLLLNKLKIV